VDPLLPAEDFCAWAWADCALVVVAVEAVDLPVDCQEPLLYSSVPVGVLLYTLPSAVA
jgi:hypothetical protein